MRTYLAFCLTLTLILRAIAGIAQEEHGKPESHLIEAAEKGERIRSRAGEPGQNLFLVKPPDFPGGMLDDAFAEGDLPVSGHDHNAVTADAQNRRRTH